ncbi:three-Cys-motif partner protein TcmP [Actinomadura sp. WMMB 499]|uniref:three-Cys-motif partner protein TcmP n=1 Tax=Actinomadura sp. WMMB 499 TaxID=1219491 RepID=UPI00124803CF|nr:three-Cys-motif partner protein TcmP [Actinomadura sp. WMMB 499]QFG23724.1 three-Cys-motif partner protein TcmP [Actinomadura sp. WMMB 499]
MVSDADPSKWDCPPHTKSKHDMLASYLDGWYPILSSWNGRVLFLDGFAGRGRYNDGTEGSPLVALQRLIDHHYFPQMMHREFVFMFIEANEDNATSLEWEIDSFKTSRAPWPANVKVSVINAKFDATANAILGYLREQKANLAPTFAFVDPFGYSGLPMDLLAELLSYPRTEVFVNFMVGHVQRFIERDSQEAAMRSLFGMDVRDVLNGHSREADRVEHLRAVYGKQLQDRIGLDYVQSFAMINSTGNIGYYLFHGTRHPKGVKLMKNAMWKIDPGGGYTFSDRLDGQDVLFTPEPDLRPLRREFMLHYTGKSNISAEEMEWYTLLRTPYRETHVRPVLRKLEREGAIKVNRPMGRKQFAKGVTIDFPSSPPS